MKYRKVTKACSKVLSLVLMTGVGAYSFSNIVGGFVFANIVRKYAQTMPGVSLGSVKRYQDSYKKQEKRGNAPAPIFNSALWDKMGVTLDKNDNMVVKQFFIPKPNNSFKKISSYVYHTYISSNDGVSQTPNKLSTYVLLPPRDPSVITPQKGKWIILVHGITVDWTIAALTAQSWLLKGYNCIVYDQQGVNKNKKDSFGFLGSSGTNPSFGYYEQNNLHSVVTDVQNIIKSLNSEFSTKLSSLSGLGLYGISMGAATLLMYLTKWSNDDKKKYFLKFAIVDSAYASLYQELKDVTAGTYKIPPFLVLPGACLWYEGFYHTNPYKINPGNNLSKVTIPTMIIQGTADKFVPYVHNFWKIYNGLTNLTDKGANPKKTYIQLAGATHGDHFEWNNLISKYLGYTNKNLMVNKSYTEGPFFKPMLDWTIKWI